MSALSNIPAQAVLPLGAYDLGDLCRSAERTDQRLLRVDLGSARTKAAVIEAIGKAFELPKHFGRNLDALYDCVTELDPGKDAEHPGLVVILENVPDTTEFDATQRDALLDVFREAADFFFDRDTAFRVFYSVHGKR
jgi:RNAse (barnase) inhibitor barstar